MNAVISYDFMTDIASITGVTELFIKPQNI